MSTDGGQLAGNSKNPLSPSGYRQYLICRINKIRNPMMSKDLRIVLKENIDEESLKGLFLAIPGIISRIKDPESRLNAITDMLDDDSREGSIFALLGIISRIKDPESKVDAIIEMLDFVAVKKTH